jgi:MFS transporter, FSR family, fosmidomycin resistance protein
MKNKLSIIMLYSFGHFYVDFICSLVLSLLLFKNPENIAKIAGLIILYNVIAFGTQPFFGFLVDKYDKAKESAVIGILISTVGLIFFFKPIVATILLGIGNAIYHVGGGVISLNLDPSKAKYPGVYVSTGALGLFIGAILGYLQVNPLIFVLGGIIVSTGLIFLIKNMNISKTKKFKEKKVNLIGIVLILLLVSVCMRSLVSYSLNLGWKSVFILGLLMTIAIFLGKFFGGILADKYGFMNVGLSGLIIAAPLLTFFQTSPVAVIIGLFCFNLVMPITLTAVAEAIPNFKGTAFGLTTLALVFGYLFFFLLKNYLTLGIWFTALVIVVNIGSLYFGLKKYEEMKI